MLQDLHVFEHAISQRVFFELVELDVVVELLTKLNMDDTPLGIVTVGLGVIVWVFLVEGRF